MRKWACVLCMGAGVALSVAACTAEKTNAVQKTSENLEAESGQPGQEAGEQTPEEETAREDPACVYYIKDNALMRINVRENPEAGSGAEKLFDLPENKIILKDHDGAVYTEDGRLAAFLLNVSDMEDTWNIDELLIAADNQSGDAKELYRGFGTVKAGKNALYYLIQEAGTENNEAVMPVNLYRYTPEQGSEKLAERVDSFDLLRDGSVVFARLREDGGKDLYLSENGKETLLAEGMYYSGSEAPDSSLYVWRDAQEDRSYKELAVVGRDGSRQEILTGEEEAWSCYIDGEADGVYYVRGMETPMEENGWNAERALFYKERGGEPACLTKDLQGIWGYEKLEEADSVRNVLLYTAGEPEQTELYGAVGGKAFLLEPEDRQWSLDLAITWTGAADGTIDLAFQKWGRDFQIEGGGIYRLRWNEDHLNPPALMAEGCEVAVQRPIGGGDETLFYSNYPLDGQGGYGDSISLYCENQEILADYVSGSLMAAGESGTEYFALSQKKSEEEGAHAAASDLTRVTSAGSSKVMKEDVALCEPWEGGLLMLADCEKEYPYRGSLCFYDGQEIRTLDDGVTVFFGHGSGTVAEAVPKEWDLYGDREDLELQEIPVEDLWWESRGYIEGDTYYSTAEGFTLDLAPFTDGGSFTIPDHGSCLFYFEDDENIQAFQLVVSEEDGAGYASAEEYGNHLKEQYEVSLRAMKNFGVNTDGLRLVVESAENMELDGREAFRMSYFTGTEEKKLSRILLYAIPDREANRMILLAGTLYAEDAACEEICAGVAESLRWEEP